MPSLHYHHSWRLFLLLFGLAALFTLSLSSPAELRADSEDTQSKDTEAKISTDESVDSPKKARLVSQAVPPNALMAPSVLLPAIRPTGRIMGLGLPLSKLPSWLKTHRFAALFYAVAAGYSTVWLRKSPNLERLIWQSELTDSLDPGSGAPSTSTQKSSESVKPEILPGPEKPEEPKVGLLTKADSQGDPYEADEPSFLHPKKASTKITMDMLLTTLGALPTDQLRHRAAALKVDGQPALSAEQLSVVSAYNIWKFAEDLRPRQQKLFLSQLTDFKPDADPASKRLISAFQSHLDRIITSNLHTKAKNPIFRAQQKPPPIPFAELETTFDDMDADDVFARLRRASMFSHLDLRKSDRWLASLKEYIADLPPVKRHMFYVAGLGLSPGTTLKSIALEWQSRPGSVQRIKGSLADKIPSVLLEEHTHDIKHTFAGLEARFKAMPATEVFARLDHTDIFDVPAATTDPDIEISRHQILKDQLAESDPFKRHLFYSYFLELDQTTPEQIAEGWGVSKSSAKLYLDFLTSKISAAIQTGNDSLTILSFEQLEKRFEEMDPSKIIARLQRSLVFRKSLLQRILFTEEGLSELKDHLASSLEVKRHVFYSTILKLDGHSLEEIAQKWDVTYGGAWYHKDSLIKAMEAIFSSAPEPESLDDSAETLSTLEIKFLGMDRAEVSHRLERSGMLMDCDLKKCPLTDQHLQNLQDYLLKSPPEARRIFYSLFLQMEKTRLKHLSGQMNIKYRLAWNTQFRLRSEITSLLQNNGSWTQLPHSLEQMDAEFKAISNETLLNRLQSSSLLASSHQDPQLTMDDLTRFRQAILRSAPIRRHVFYSFFLKLNNHLPSDVADRWQVAPLAVQYHVGHLSNFISDVFQATDKRRLIHSFDTLEEMFIDMEPTEVMDRLRKVDAFQGIEISHEDYGVLRSSLAGDNVLRRHIFYSHFLMMDSSTLNEIAAVWHYSYGSAWYHKHNLQVNLSRLLKEQRSPNKMHHSFEDLEAEFLAMAPSHVLNSLHHTADLGDQFDADHQLTKMNYQIFREMLLDYKPRKRHIFYVFFLGMDDISLKEIAALWQVSYAKAWHDKNHIRLKMTKMFESSQPPLHYKRTFEVMDADFWKMPPSDIWDRLSRSEQLQEVNMVFSNGNYKAFTKYITQISPVRRHVLYSLVLKMDMSTKGSIARQWNMSDDGVRYHESQLVAEIIEVFNKPDPHHSQPSFEELDGEFLTMPPSEALLRLRSFADLPKKLTKELTEDAYPELRNYMAKSLPIKRHVFYTRFLQMDSRSAMNLAVMYNVGRTTISYHVHHIQKTLKKIFHSP